MKKSCSLIFISIYNTAKKIIEKKGEEHSSKIRRKIPVLAEYIFNNNFFLKTTTTTFY
jgi:hypothetical protein